MALWAGRGGSARGTRRGLGGRQEVGGIWVWESVTYLCSRICEGLDLRLENPILTCRKFWLNWAGLTSDSEILGREECFGCCFHLDLLENSELLMNAPQSEAAGRKSEDNGDPLRGLPKESRWRNFQAE